MNRYISASVALVVVLSVALGTLRRPATAAPADIGYRDFRFGSECNSTPSGEKPESKLWWNDGFWWGSLCTAGNTYHIHRLDVPTQTWIDTGTPLDDRPSSKADALWDGQKLYIASHLFSNTGEPSSSPAEWGRLYRYSYDPATKTYSLDSGFPVDVSRGRSETLVLEKAANGQLWITYVEAGNVMVNHSTGDDSTWAVPFVLPANSATNLTDDDISSIITFDRGTATPKVGILWSNQNTQRMSFAVHQDGAPATAWNSFSLSMPSNGNPAPADDHINIKLQSNGVGIYAVMKTSNEGANEPLVVLLSCRAMCDTVSNWQATPVYTFSEDRTRSILLLDTTNRKVNIFSTISGTGGRIERAIFNMDTLSPTSVPESKTLFIQNSPDTRVNNPTSTKQTVNSTTGLLVLASDQDSRFYLHNYDPLAGPAPTSTATPTTAAPPTPTTPTPPTPSATPPATISSQIFLPLIMRPSLPDLVGSINLIPNKSTFEAGEPAQINVTIANIGTAPSRPAWVDLYINPSSPPVAPSTPWNLVCGLQPCFGLVWVVPALEPGQSIVLTSSVGSFAAPYSIWPGWFARGTTDLYLYIDSWNPGVPSGLIAESNEANNRAEQHGLQVIGRNPTLADRIAVDLPERGPPPEK